MASLKIHRLDGDNETAHKMFEEYLKELGVDLEDDENEED